MAKFDQSQTAKVKEEGERSQFSLKFLSPLGGWFEAAAAVKRHKQTTSSERASDREKEEGGRRKVSGDKKQSQGAL